MKGNVGPAERADSMPEKSDKLDFIRAQYDQYWEMKRFHLKLSWNIPTIVIAAILALIAIDPDRATNWEKDPLLPAFILLLAGFFVLLMYIHNQRNLWFAGVYEKVLIELEQEYGVTKMVHHQQIKGGPGGLLNVSSSKCLSSFLLVLAVFLLAASVYFWIRLLL